MNELPIKVTGKIHTFKMREISIEERGLKKQSTPVLRPYLRSQPRTGLCFVYSAYTLLGMVKHA